MIFLGVALIAILLMAQKTSGSEYIMSEPKQRLYDLKDVLPENQGGNYKTDFDLYFEKSADQYGVPFALLKAHAIAESSLNPKAFMDESKTGSNRQGWASRGLMQLLFWPKSTRFEKYGFSSTRSVDDFFDPETNIDVAAQLIRDNLRSCKGNIRDAINMYNTGAKESVRIAPNGYVDKVLGYYNKLIGG